MGHSIIAFNDAISIARLEFGATNYVRSSYLYKILNAEDCNNGVSGNGESKFYTYEDILEAKAALTYYEKEPFELVRNAKNEQQATLFLGNFPGINPTDREHSSMLDISDGLSSIKEFLETILKVASTKVEINFG